MSSESVEQVLESSSAVYLVGCDTHGRVPKHKYNPAKELCLFVPVYSPVGLPDYQLGPLETGQLIPVVEKVRNAIQSAQKAGRKLGKPCRIELIDLGGQCGVAYEKLIFRQMRDALFGMQNLWLPPRWQGWRHAATSRKTFRVGFVRAAASDRVSGDPKINQASRELELLAHQLPASVDLEIWVSSSELTSLGQNQLPNSVVARHPKVVHIRPNWKRHHNGAGARVTQMIEHYCHHVLSI